MSAPSGRGTVMDIDPTDDLFSLDESSQPLPSQQFPSLSGAIARAGRRRNQKFNTTWRDTRQANCRVRFVSDNDEDEPDRTSPQQPDTESLFSRLDERQAGLGVDPNEDEVSEGSLQRFYRALSPSRTAERGAPFSSDYYGDKNPAQQPRAGNSSAGIDFQRDFGNDQNEDEESRIPLRPIPSTSPEPARQRCPARQVRFGDVQVVGEGAELYPPAPGWRDPRGRSRLAPRHLPASQLQKLHNGDMTSDISSLEDQYHMFRNQPLRSRHNRASEHLSHIDHALLASAPDQDNTETAIAQDTNDQRSISRYLDAADPLEALLEDTRREEYDVSRWRTDALNRIPGQARLVLASRTDSGILADWSNIFCPPSSHDPAQGHNDVSNGSAPGSAGSLDHGDTEVMQSLRGAGPRFIQGTSRSIALRSTVFRLGMGELNPNAAAHLQNIPDTLGFEPNAALVYDLQPSPTGTDVWPDIRDFSKTPARITAIHGNPKDFGKRGFTPKHIANLIGSHEQQRANKKPKIGPLRPTWPVSDEKKLLPLELYEMIIQHLSRDDIKALRMTCKRIEFSISHFLFKTVVVPFNTEIYGMLERIAPVVDEKKWKGKGKATDGPLVGGNLVWKNSAAEDVYNGHGIDVFRGFGPHMKRFGMSFEVDEDVLSSLPRKELLQKVRTYWGEYDWPFPDYQRFKEIANLENTADETPLMVKAFSHLKKVEELALSIDNGLGWLHGPDVILHRRIFKKSPPVFRGNSPVPDRRSAARRQLWELMKKLAPEGDDDNISSAVVRHCLINLPPSSFDALHRLYSAANLTGPEPIRAELGGILDFIRNADELKQLIDIISSGRDAMSDGESRRGVSGMLAFDLSPPNEDGYVSQPVPLQPLRLTKPQKEWLLETQWAQQAFISSYILGVMDNKEAFKNVHTLNFARIPTQYFTYISRDDFWNSLPKLSNVTILALAAWRSVSKDDASYVEVTPSLPSRSVQALEDLLINIIALRRQITTLNVGWASGGEQGTGVFGRNQHLMPAPVMPSRWLETNMTSAQKLREEMILFPSLQHLTLTNCWILPVVLAVFIKNNTKALKTLTLDSVSLSPHIRGMQRMLVGELHEVQDPVANAANAGHPMQQGVQQHAVAQNAVAQWATLAQGPNGPANAVQNNNQPFARPPNGQVNQARIAAIQAQLQGQHAVHPPLPPQPAQLPNPRNGNNQGTWRGPHKVGSWPWLLDCISPGIRVTHISGEPSDGVPSVLPSKYPLKSITFKSCGYARVTYQEQSVDIVPLDVICTQRSASLAWKRSYAYMGDMMGSSDTLMGQVSQYMAEHEVEALQRVWNLTMGWSDEEAARAVFYDGYLLGGTGRFSGAIDDHVPVVENAMNDA